MPPARALLCTVGTSLKGNLEGLLDGSSHPDLADAYRARNFIAVAHVLSRLPATDRVCGAEINSIAHLRKNRFIAEDADLHFFHSDTDDGRWIADVLKRFYQQNGQAVVEAVEVSGLQDKDPQRFRAHGLRKLAQLLCKVIRERDPSVCAINATGGYKAQIAVAVLIGQAVGVPVYYKHEYFDDIIAFPPMPVALDFTLWLKANPMLFDLERRDDLIPFAEFRDEWDEKYDSLVERETIDQTEYITLSATGQIFHETFRERFRLSHDQLLPPAAAGKSPPVLEKAGWPGEHPDVGRFLQELTNDVPQVTRCATVKLLGKRQSSRFKEGQDCVEGIYDNGKIGVLFRVETTATTREQMGATVAVLNEWLERQR